MKTAVITGANRGIGLGLARELAGRHYNVIGTSRIVADAEELAEVASVM
jgi:NAD(P)-dependent dehydrogenase (short-subunit alcohol dehydrogenase family)